MKKYLLVVTAQLLFVSGAVVNLDAANNIAEVDNVLKSNPLNYKERHKVGIYLRRHFNNQKENLSKKPLSGDAKVVAEKITKMYESIPNKEAANNFMHQAAGAVLLYKNPVNHTKREKRAQGYRKVKAKPSRSSEADKAHKSYKKSKMNDGKLAPVVKKSGSSSSASKRKEMLEKEKISRAADESKKKAIAARKKQLVKRPSAKKLTESELKAKKEMKRRRRLAREKANQ